MGDALKTKPCGRSLADEALQTKPYGRSLMDTKPYGRSLMDDALWTKPPYGRSLVDEALWTEPGFIECIFMMILHLTEARELKAPPLMLS